MAGRDHEELTRVARLAFHGPTAPLSGQPVRWLLLLSCVLVWSRTADARPLQMVAEGRVPLGADGLVLEGAGTVSSGSAEWQLPPDMWPRGAEGIHVAAELYWRDERAVLTLSGWRGSQPATAASQTADYAPSTYRYAAFAGTQVETIKVALSEYAPDDAAQSGGVEYRLRCLVRWEESESAESIEEEVRALSLGQPVDRGSLAQERDHWWELQAPEGADLPGAGSFPNVVLFVALDAPAGADASSRQLDRYDLRIYDAEKAGRAFRNPRLRRTALRDGTGAPSAQRPLECVMPLEDSPAQLMHGATTGRRLLARVRLLDGSRGAYRIRAYLADLSAGDVATRARDALRGARDPGTVGLWATRDPERPLVSVTETGPFRRRLIAGARWGTHVHRFRPTYPGTIYAFAPRDAGAARIRLSSDGLTETAPDSRVWSRPAAAGRVVDLQVTSNAGVVDYSLTSLIVPDWGAVPTTPDTSRTFHLSYERVWRGLADLGSRPGQSEVRVDWDGPSVALDLSVYSRDLDSSGAYRFEQRASIVGKGGGSDSLAVPYLSVEGREYVALVSLNSRLKQEVGYVLEHTGVSSGGSLDKMARGHVTALVAGTAYSFHEQGPTAITVHVLGRQAGAAEDLERIAIRAAGETIQTRKRRLSVGGTEVVQHVVGAPSGPSTYTVHVPEGIDTQGRIYYTRSPYDRLHPRDAGNDRVDRAERATLPDEGMVTLRGRLDPSVDRVDVWLVSSADTTRTDMPKIELLPSDASAYADVYDIMGKLLDLRQEARTAGPLYVVVRLGAPSQPAGGSGAYAIRVSDPRRPPDAGDNAYTTETYIESSVDFE
jgi:hypothetical protein